MQPDRIPEEHNTQRIQWVAILGVFLFALALLWSVDKSVVYVLIGAAAFSLFKILHDRSARERKISGDRDFTTPSQVWLFWQELKEEFRKSSGNSKNQSPQKTVWKIVLGIVGFIFFISLITSLFSPDSSDAYTSGEYQKAIDYYNARQYDSAAYYYGLVLAKDSENAVLYFERGNAFLNASKTDSALLMYEQALALDPQYEQAQYNKAYIYFERKNYRQSIDEAKAIMEYNPGYIDGMLIIGDSFYNQSQLDSALRWYEGAYTKGYRSAILCHLMAYIYDVKGNTPVAIDLYKEAIGQDSTITNIYTRLGELVSGEEGEWFRQRAASMRQ
jgi:tetratricopeptide (TPR) repeat protein